MPPKESAKKSGPSILRPSISTSSLFFVPQDVIEGFQERIETGIDWTLIATAMRHHKKVCSKENIPTITFSDALNGKIENSIFGSFLNEQSSLTLEQQWELLLPITLWDNEKVANEEKQICFLNNNNITDDMIKMIKVAVRVGDREVLRRSIKMVNVLRVTDQQMTDLDKSLLDFKRLVSLNVCGNCIENLDATFIPPSVKSIELQANRIKSVRGFAEHLPRQILYLGLARNFLKEDSFEGLGQFPYSLTVLDLSDNDIYDLEAVLEGLVRLPSLTSLMLIGNPCSVCMGYAKITLLRLPRLVWLDLRKILPSDRPSEPIEPHPDDALSAYFNFTVFRVMSVPPPPKPDKGAITTFHIELEIPLLDSVRRQFLMFRKNESLTEMLPTPEDYELPSKVVSTSAVNNDSKFFVAVDSSATLDEAVSNHEFDVYKSLTVKNSLEIRNYTTFESNRVQWNKIMNFTEPTVRIFCPDLVALRNTFRTAITIRLVFSLTSTAKPGKIDKKSQHSIKIASEQRLVLATIRCALKPPDWSQPSQHFHWDESLGTKDAIHWGDGDLSVLQYTPMAVKPTKGKPGEPAMDSRQMPPDILTCHFGFGVDTLMK